MRDVGVKNCEVITYEITFFFLYVKGSNFVYHIIVLANKRETKSMCCKIYNRLLNIPWQVLSSCVRDPTALLVFVIHSLHTPQAGAYCGALACHEVGLGAFYFFTSQTVWSHFSRLLQQYQKQGRLSAITGCTVKVKQTAFTIITPNCIYNKHFPPLYNKERRKMENICYDDDDDDYGYILQ